MSETSVTISHTRNAKLFVHVQKGTYWTLTEWIWSQCKRRVALQALSCVLIAIKAINRTRFTGISAHVIAWGVALDTFRGSVKAAGTALATRLVIITRKTALYARLTRCLSSVHEETTFHWALAFSSQGIEQEICPTYLAIQARIITSYAILIKTGLAGAINFIKEALGTPLAGILLGAAPFELTSLTNILLCKNIEEHASAGCTFTRIINTCCTIWVTIFASLCQVVKKAAFWTSLGTAFTIFNTIILTTAWSAFNKRIACCAAIWTESTSIRYWV